MRLPMIAALAGALASYFWPVEIAPAQQQPVLSSDTLYEVSQMLQDARDEVKKHYFDPKLNGLDWDARYKEYAAMLPKTHNLGDAFGVVAAFLGELKDSHVFFIPPDRQNRYEDGYHLQIIGDQCFVSQIRPKSDAEEKLKIGDQVLMVDGYNVNRQDFHDLRYFYSVLSPMPAARLVLRSPDGAQRTVIVKHEIKIGKAQVDLSSEGDTTDLEDLVRRGQNARHASRAKMVEQDDIAIWKLRRFDLDFEEVEHFIGIARKHKTLILDLRGNGGGRVDTLKEIVGYLFDKEIKIGDRVGRKDSKPMIAKRQGNPFTGKLIVLVDSGSASASELLARVVQLEHRGTVIGDKTAGAVMESRIYEDSRGVDVKIFYDFSITDANLIMTDGKSLEKLGVTPEEILLPTGADLAAGRDPVLAHAAELAGTKLDPATAGKMFPFEWTSL
jgi:carboxyl-terminal processing protease